MAIYVWWKALRPTLEDWKSFTGENGGQYAPTGSASQKHTLHVLNLGTSSPKAPLR